MNIEKPMPLLLIEDNEEDVRIFNEYIKTRLDVKLIKSTNSSYEGLDITKTYNPEGIILDLELHKGEGSGLSFLEKMKKIELDFKPIVVVTTNVSSDIIYNHIRELGADFIYYKKQKDYSPELVINSIVSLREILYSNNKINKKTTVRESQKETEEKLKNIINNELDLIGISAHLKGRKYFEDAIFYLLTNRENGSVFYFLANKYKVGNSSIGRAMQTAINYAWKTSAIDDLLIHYKARINYETGVPTPTEFIYYYAEKIGKLK